MLSPPPQLDQSSDRHALRRFFIGPLPERVLLDAQDHVLKPVKKRRTLFSFNRNQQSPSSNDEPVEELINQYAYAFHLKFGGSAEDWNEERENNVKDEMSRRWKESPWGRLWWGRKDGLTVSHGRWVLPNDAGSFQIGDFLGLNTYSELATRSPQLTPSVAGGSPARAGPSTRHRAHRNDPSTRTGDTFVTAHSHISPEPELAPMPSRSSLFPEASPNSGDDIHAATSTTSLLRVSGVNRPAGEFRIRTGPTDEVSAVKPASRARALASAKSDSTIDGSTDTSRTSDRRKGKAKKVVRLPRDPSPPAPPGAVLQRSGSEIQETSAAAAEDLQAATAPSAASIDAQDEYDDAKMKGKSIFSPLPSSLADVLSFEPLELGNCYIFPTRLHDPGPDRMVVRVACCKNDSLGPHFDELQDRSARDMQYEDWAEFMVVWRSDRLELYNDYVSLFRKFLCLLL